MRLPSDNGKKPSENQEYNVFYSEDGTITLVPKIEDPFSDGEEAEYYKKELSMLKK
ncbi:TPA: AbrB family transcriptional regulator [Enterococcus faecium]|nr:AbrB family transcriptional regulator [Enterococcus faecium]EME3574740.1 AbrB family transcriptional regulator [Enterococcus faecium]EME8074875.1 AbrB family transcriptional regulator [Enterococcus faecium]EME8145375.1 AbrB family transcriptional regulator [Enterococcus faecium]EMF0364884.1 AbrB family transcriptional regulator [Enterococcus faecium]EMF0636020.1 AbrB family transcriptional regulator [Enterococcus faecium]